MDKQQLIKKVTFVCKDCKTTIALDIPKDSDGIEELISALQDSKCPKCKTALLYQTTQILKAINEYNKSLSKLCKLLEEHNAKVE